MARRKLIRKKTADSDLIAVTIVGGVALVGALIFGVFKLLGKLLSSGGKIATQVHASREVEAPESPLAKSAQALADEIGWLRTFQEVVSWDTRAKDFIDKLLSAEEADDKYQNLAEQLQQYVDLSSESEKERRVILKELRHEKKELQLMKKELNASMRQVRTEHRVKSTQVPYSVSGFFGMTALQRQSMRWEREKSLYPMENQKEWIEAKTLELERKILGSALAVVPASTYPAFFAATAVE